MPGPAFAFDDLPESLALAILGSLDVKERCRAALVCRAWRQLARSPELLRDVDASVSVAAYEQLPAATRSLRAWLAAHASDQLHSLTVRLNSTAAYEYYADPAAWVEDYKEPASRAPAAAAAAAQLQAALAALGAAAPGLRHLRLHAAGMQLVLGDWAAELAPRLHSLEVDLLAQTEFFEHALGVAAPLHCFSALRELRLSAYHLVLPAAGLRLPLSLTKLHLSCEMDKPNEHGEFPEESLTVAPLLRPLKALCSLSLCGIDVDDIEWGRLAPSLTHLALTDAYQLPPGLSQLTRLRSFARESRQDESEFVPAPGWRMGAAEPMLRALTQLTFLALQDLECRGDYRAPVEERVVLPDALTALRCLHTFCCKAFTGALPAGEWLASLRRLALPPVAAAASLGALAQATALEELCLVHLEDAVALEGFEVFGRTKQSVASDGVASVVDELAVLEWAARRPGLRRLALGSRMFQQYTPAQATLLAATAACTSAANPGLRVEQDWRLYREIAARLAGRRLVEQALPGSEPPPPEQPPAGEGCDSEEYVSDSDLGWW